MNHLEYSCKDPEDGGAQVKFQMEVDGAAQ